MRFVTSESKRLYLKKRDDQNEADWIEVKKELSIGEDKRFRVAGMRGVSKLSTGTEEDVRIDVDWGLMAIARVEAYLTDWSAKRKVSREAIEMLDKDDFEEIDALILQHIEETAQEKKQKVTA